MQITIEVKNVYGKQTIYPACEKSEIFASMLGQKTLTTSDLTKIKSLGFEVVQKHQDLKF